MKKIYLLLGLLLILAACAELDNNLTPVTEIRDVKLKNSYDNGDASWAYEIYLPTIWEENLDEHWDGYGWQVPGGEVQPLSLSEKANAYILKINAVNQNLFFRFGHYRYEAHSAKTIWANAKYLPQSKYFIPLDSQGYLGVTVRNGAVSQVDPASFTKLTAIIDANPLEVREGGEVSFSGLRSTGSALPPSQIIKYDWDFGDGTTASGASVKHVYSVKGDYRLLLTVTDDLGASASAERQIKVFRMSFPENVLEGGDDYLQVSEDRYNKTITIYVNLALTHGYHGKPFWWGTELGSGTAWVFKDIPAVPLNEDWGMAVLPFDGRQQYEFNYSDYYDYLNGDGRPVGVNWDHMPWSKFYDPLLGHYIMLVANGKISRPY